MDRDSSHGRKPAAAKRKELSPGDVAAAAAASVRRLSLSSEVFSEVEG